MAVIEICARPTSPLSGLVSPQEETAHRVGPSPVPVAALPPACAQVPGAHGVQQMAGALAPKPPNPAGVGKATQAAPPAPVSSAAELPARFLLNPGIIHGGTVEVTTTGGRALGRIDRVPGVRLTAALELFDAAGNLLARLDEARAPATRTLDVWDHANRSLGQITFNSSEAGVLANTRVWDITDQGGTLVGQVVGQRTGMRLVFSIRDGGAQVGMMEQMSASSTEWSVEATGTRIDPRVAALLGAYLHGRR